MIDERSWITICAEMYGQIDRKPMEHWPSAPPVNVSNHPNSVESDCRMSFTISWSTVQFTPGVGICATRRHTNTSPSVTNIFFLSSGIRNALEKPFIIAIAFFLLFALLLKCHLNV